MRYATASRPLLWCGFALAFSVATVGTANESKHSDQPGSEAELNVPPQELLHPEQFGIEDMGHRSATAVIASFADEASPAPPAMFGRTTPVGVQAKSLQLPGNFVDGGFANIGAGWLGFMAGGGPFGDIHVPTLAMNRGNPAPSGAPALRSDHSSPSGIPQCSGDGQMWQDIHVKPGSRLRFDWLPAYTQATSGVSGTLGVSLRDPYTQHQIWNLQTPSYTAFLNTRVSEVDLSTYAGLDVRVVFASGPRFDLLTKSCNNWTWFDNVNVFQSGINYQNVQPYPGVWYNPHRTGGGLDLRAMPGDSGFYAIWYTFQGGQPTWYYLDPAQVVNGEFETNIRKMVRNGTTVQQTVVGRFNLRMLSTTNGLMSFDFFDHPNTGSWDNTEHFQLLSAGGARNYNGYWHPATPNDPNWGLTTLSYGSNLFSTQYFYDAGGQPTWTLAQGPFTGSASLDVRRATGGLCPNCAGSYPTIQYQSVGTLSIAIPTPSSDSMVATFVAGDWVRPRHTYYKLTN